MSEQQAGPLSGVKVLEMAGIGPAPMAAMMLAELGATVLRIDRRTGAAGGIERPTRFNFVLRGRRSISLDLKEPRALALVLRLVSRSDVLVEGFRPGVMERLGLGPQLCHDRNPRLVYGRVTGWGQDGPLAQAAGHDINYVALSGVLHAIGRGEQPPTIPLNLVGDYAGGSLYLVVGVLAALIEARRTGQGQVIDAAIVDGASHLATSLFGLMSAGLWSTKRGTNIADSGAWFYDTYECSDGHWVSIGPLEPKFLAELLARLGADPANFGSQLDPAAWPSAREQLARIFRSRTRQAWCELLEGTDACFAPVLSMPEAVQHPHMVHRRAFMDLDGQTQPAPAPRFSRWPQRAPLPPQATDADVGLALEPFLEAEEIERLRHDGVLRDSQEVAE